jgi:hypothetical protein
MSLRTTLRHPILSMMSHAACSAEDVTTGGAIERGLLEMPLLHTLLIRDGLIWRSSGFMEVNLPKFRRDTSKWEILKFECLGIPSFF